MPKKKIEPVLHVFEDKSVLYDSKGNVSEFKEGKLSERAKERLATIRTQLENGYLENLIEEAKKPDVIIDGLTEEQIRTIENLVASVTSEVGRAIVGLSVLQLTIKSISIEQSNKIA